MNKVQHLEINQDLAEECDESFKRVHSNPKNEIKFFKFDKNMKYYYTHDDKVIKKYLYETSTLVKNFEGHNETLKNLMFTIDFSFMIRYSLYLP